MKSRPSVAPALVAVFVLSVIAQPLAAQPTARRAFAPRPDATPALRERLRQAADSPGLEPWQRETMRRLAQGSPPARAHAGGTPRSLSGNPSRSDYADGEWTELGSVVKLAGHSAVYDPVRDRMIVFAGYGAYFTNDIWALSLGAAPAWSRILPAGFSSPDPRVLHSAVYDPVRDRMVVFGGAYFSEYNDVWALSLSDPPTWTQLLPLGPSPAGRLGCSAVYDASRDRMVVFGGASSGKYDDVWALSLSDPPTWTELFPSGGPPAARSEHTAVLDPSGDRMLIFGGAIGGPDSLEVLLGDVWALSFSGSPAWTELFPAGSPPAARRGHGAVYDAAGARMLVFGGGTDSVFVNDAWALSLSGSPAWTPLSASGVVPGARAYHTSILDPARQRMITFGGVVAFDTLGTPTDVYGDVRALSLSGSPSWSALVESSNPPSPRTGFTAVYDPLRDRMLIFGGEVYDLSGVQQLNETWVLSLSPAFGWTQLTPSGTPPAGRTRHSAIYDPVRDRMVIFGGYGGYYRNDVWGLSLGGSPAWAQLSPAGLRPPARVGHTAVYDPVSERMVVFGGYGGVYRGDTWALALGGSPAWEPLASSGDAPSPRFEHAAVFDPLRHRALVFGGRDDLYDLNDLWELSLASSSAVWSQLSPAGTPPSPRSQHVMIVDPLRERVVVHGGISGGGFGFTDAVALSLGSTEWSALAPSGYAPYLYGHSAAIYDPLRDRMIVSDGSGYYAGFSLFALSWGGVVGVEPRPPAPAGGWSVAPNPARGRVRLEFELPAAARVRVGIFDLAGRQVRELVNAPLGAGRHMASWDGRAGGGAAAPAGVYFYRALVGREARASRFVLLH